MWKDEYFRIMCGKSVTDQDMVYATALKNQNLPKKIYKYRAINENSILNLRTETVWVCSPKEYTDLYDCRCTYDVIKLASDTPHLDFDEFIKLAKIKECIPIEAIKAARNATDPIKYTMNMLARGLPSNVQFELKRLQNEVISKMADQIIQSSNSVFHSNIKICSFCEENDSMEMWEFYADDHKGFCIEYEPLRWDFRDPRKTALTPVNYTEFLFDATSHLKFSGLERKKLNFAFAIMIAAHKSTKLKYEREWRLILPLGAKSPDQNFMMPKPSCVYLGAKISERNKETIQKICIDKKIPIKVMSTSNQKFKFEVNEETPNEKKI